MKPSLVVSVSLTLAIAVVVAGLVIATRARGADPAGPPPQTRGLPVQDHLWKMKNAPAAMNVKPTA
jgi:hypothetical protein